MPRKLPVLNAVQFWISLVSGVVFYHLLCISTSGYKVKLMWKLLSFRCVDAEAYEVKREDVSNGIFINFLKQRVCEDEKVTVMLDRVAEGRALNNLYDIIAIFLN